MTPLARALAFDRAIRARAAERVVALPGGVVLRSDRLRSKWILNAVMLDAPLPGHLRSADALRRVAEDQLGGLAHRYLVLDDGPFGEAAAPAMRAAGWQVQRVQFMRLARPPVDVSPAGLARRVEEETLRELQLAMAIEERGGDGAVERSLTAALVAGEAALRAGTPWLAFAAGVPGGPPASSCTLFLDLDGRVALIDEVGTLRSCRGRGLARAVISAAARAAREHGCGEVFIAAELDDWPRLLYERMGFEAVGVQVSFALPAPPERLVASTG